MKPWIALLPLIACAALPNVRAADPPSGEGPGWMTDVGAALERAESEGAPVLVDLWAIWCEPCRVMERTTYSDPSVLRVMRGFVPLKLNADEEELFVQRYDAETLPTTLFLDHEGREIARRVGYLSASELSLAANLIADGYDAYLETVALRDDPIALERTAAYLLWVGNADEAIRLVRRALKLLKKEDPARSEPVRLVLARALAADGRNSAAAKELEKLAESAYFETIRAWALAEWIRVERKRGETERAEELSQRLLANYPELAPTP
jgi:thioredoxin-like negative regulator of GroEL